MTITEAEPYSARRAPVADRAAANRRMRKPYRRSWREQVLHVRAVKGDGRAAIELANRYFRTFRPDLARRGLALLALAWRRGCPEAGYELVSWSGGSRLLTDVEGVTLLEQAAAERRADVLRDLTDAFGGLISRDRLRAILCDQPEADWIDDYLGGREPVTWALRAAPTKLEGGWRN